MPRARPAKSEQRAAPARGDRLWTHAETAEYLRISPSTLHGMNYKGTGPRSYRVGKHRRYDPVDVRAWLEQSASD